MRNDDCLSDPYMAPAQPDVKRLQRRRVKGWRLPPGAICCTRPGKWSNPYGDAEANDPAIIGIEGFAAITPQERKVELYRFGFDFMDEALLREFLAPLRGRDLACWCRLCPAHQDGKPLGVHCDACMPCHVDVLLDLANGGPSDAQP